MGLLNNYKSNIKRFIEIEKKFSAALIPSFKENTYYNIEFKKSIEK